MNKKKVVIPILASILTLGILTGVSYAYFSAKITENNKTETIMKSNELGLTFTGVSEINASSMIPGDSFTKTFSVENTSNRAVDFNVYMQNITNEFNEDLVYTLTDDNGVVVSETALPVTNTGKSYLKTNVEIDSGVTKNYTLKIEYKYLDTPQNDYQGKTFKATLGIDTERVGEEFNITGNIVDVTTGKGIEGKLVFYSERRDIEIKDNGEFSIEKLETGQHSVYYVGNINVENMVKDEIISNSICNASFTVPKDKNIQFHCNIGTEIQINDLQYEKWEQTKLCKRATKLHSEDCQTYSKCYNMGYTSNGIKGTNIVTYGSVPEKNGESLITGNAFICDVNGDGYYDDEYELFYYVSDYYDTIKNEFNSDIAAMIMAYSTTRGIADNKSSAAIKYYDYNNNGWGPVIGKNNLPTVEQWPKIKLHEEKRQLLNENNIAKTDYRNLGLFDYTGYAARLLTYQEVYNGCYNGEKLDYTNSLKNCEFLFENTSFINKNYGLKGSWLETPVGISTNCIHSFSGDNLNLVYANSMSYKNYVIRPTIDVPKNEISLK